MSIKDIKPTQLELNCGFEFPPEDRLREVAAEIFLKCQDEWKERILHHLSDEEIQELLKDEDFCKYNEVSLAQVARTELRCRATLARAIQVGTPYCIYHDCKTTDCPDGHFDDE